MVICLATNCRDDAQTVTLRQIVARSVLGRKSEMNTFEQLFMNNKTHENAKELLIRDLHEFDGHPFRVVDDEDMEALVQSIRERGILVPVMVRTRKDGGYEIISGHRRCHAAQQAGLFKVPAVINELSDEEAVDAMIYTNIHRSSILPSEKAHAYRMQMEIIRHPGIKGYPSSTIAGKKYGDNARKVQRYIRLTFLIDDLLALVDEGKLSMQAGYSLSFIKAEHQRWVAQLFRETNKLPSGHMAEKIRSSSEDKDLSPEKLRSMMTGKRHRKKDIVLHREKIEKYFPPDTGEEVMENLICRLLDQWSRQNNGTEM